MKTPRSDGLEKTPGGVEPKSRPSTSDILGRNRNDSHDRPRTVVDGKWAWHYRALIQMRERLSGDRSALATRASDPMEKFSMDLADAATDEFDHDLALSQLSAVGDALVEIDDAIGRISDGKYGICEATGALIGPERLRAIPWARYTMEAEAELERKGVIPRRHLGAVASLKGKTSSDLEDSETEEEKQLPDPTDEILTIVPAEPKPRNAVRGSVQRPKNDSKGKR